MKDRTALVTGGTSGIGLSIVRQLVAEQYNVYFIGTNAVQGNALEAALRRKTDKRIKFISLDLSNLKEVRRFAKEFAGEQPQLDLLANIAGVLLPKRIETEEGIEMNFAISYLSAYVLSMELLPLLKKSPEPGIVNVGAKPAVVLRESIDFDDLGSVHQYNAFNASSKAVHAKTVLTHFLSEKFAPYNITVNSFDPGMVRSKLLRKMPAMIRLISKLFFMFAPKESKAGIVACTSGKRRTTGKLFTGENFLEIAFQEEYKTKLLQATEAMNAASIGYEK